MIAMARSTAKTIDATVPRSVKLIASVSWVALHGTGRAVDAPPPCADPELSCRAGHPCRQDGRPEGDLPEQGGGGHGGIDTTAASPSSTVAIAAANPAT